MYRDGTSFLAGLAALIASTVPSLANTYVADLNFFDPGISIEGSITTDGKIGVLSLSDIVGFDLIVSGSVSSVELLPAFASVVLSGDDLVSTGRTLTFAYGAPDGGVFGFHHSFSPTGVLNWCNGTGGQDTCGQGITIQELFTGISSFTPISETLTIATAPEPSTWAMALVGFAAMALVRWRGQDFKHPRPS